MLPSSSGYVAFFRNLNLGQARSHSPTSAELLGAFDAAGADAAVNFQTNGTVVFSVPAGLDPAALARDVVRRLGPVCGYADAVVVRSAAWVAELADRLETMPGECTVSVYDAVDDLPARDSARWGEFAGYPVETLEHEAGHAVTLWNDPTSGDASAVALTRLVGVPVTARGAGTMKRLAARLRSLA